MNFFSAVRAIVSALFLLTSLLSSVPAHALPPPGDPAELLVEARGQLQRRKVADAVRALRSILRDHPRSEQVAEATELLAEHGYALEFHVVFDTRKALEKFQLLLPDMVRESDHIRTELDAFFKQVYTEHKNPYLEIVLFDSRGKYKKRYKKAGRRSVVERLKPAKGEPDGFRFRIGLFYDVRISNQKDILRALHVSLARAMASAMHSSNLKQALPASLESGLADYLSARLFSENYYSIPRTPEGILRGYARQGLSQYSKLKSFESFLLGGPPAGKSGPGRERRWAGLSYAVVDVLINGRHGKKGKDADAKPGPRNTAFQAFLRDFAAEAPGKALKPKARARAVRKLLETRCRNHFDLGLADLHKAYLEHVQGYVVGELDGQGLEEI